MTAKQPEALIRADELEQIGAESSLARAMAAHTIRLQYKENARLHEVNAEMLNALYAVEAWLSTGEGTGFQDKVSAAINKAEGKL